MKNNRLVIHLYFLSVAVEISAPRVSAAVQRHVRFGWIRGSRVSRRAESQRPIHAWLYSPVGDQSSTLDKTSASNGRGAWRVSYGEKCDVCDGKFTGPRVPKGAAPEIAVPKTLSRPCDAILSRRRAILRSTHDPDYNGGFVRLLEQLLAPRISVATRILGRAARAAWRPGGSGPYTPPALRYPPLIMRELIYSR